MALFRAFLLQREIINHPPKAGFAYPLTLVKITQVPILDSTKNPLTFEARTANQAFSLAQKRFPSPNLAVEPYHA